MKSGFRTNRGVSEQEEWTMIRIVGGEGLQEAERVDFFPVDRDEDTIELHKCWISALVAPRVGECRAVQECPPADGSEPCYVC